MSSVNSNSVGRSPSLKEDGLAQLSRSAENAKRIKNVQDKFVNSQNLQKEGRALVGEGILMKVCRKKPKQRAFFLFNDILVYGRVVISGRRYSQQKMIPLNEIQIGAPIDSAENPYAWLISSPKKSFIVRANSDRERQEWLTHLDRCIRYASGGANTQHNAVAAHWIPDDKADTCMHCRTAKFSAYNRKHHCRNCGLVVCDGCSKKRYLISHLDAKPVRVCDSCYAKLNNNDSNDARLNQRDRPADSSDSDGDENPQYSPIPATFYQNVENL
ncbi:unnamed protein product [Adineta steineri]|uniref:Uncharacterized protein n=1 Tax=Adineta steineri TaxID=433720 RepID=A0A814ZZ14_9BILA|nr:unnamed protein product [Adineta steineri]CAF1609431.1 unnamed protein product [Adineta steineri]